jgi:hypothetical protein
MPSLTLKIFKLCMIPDLNIVNNFLNGVAINFGTDSNLNILGILKGFKPCGKNLINSLKFYLVMVFTTMSLGWHMCMQEI